MDEFQDDRRLTLGEIAAGYQRPLVSLLMDIQQRKKLNAKLLDVEQNLECFRLDGHSLLRCTVDASRQHDYVALSYAWTPSADEDSSSGKYWVEARDRIHFNASPVRNSVFDRVRKYMKYFHVPFFWIDKHSMKQRHCRDPLCDHDLCQDRRDGLEAMDVVYRLSNHPVGLLAKPVTSADDLAVLYGLLTRDVDDRNSTPREDRNALRVLEEITSDPWWDRGWIYQEQYLSGQAMHLLIPCLVYEKRRYVNVFGNVDGELCVNFVNFTETATRFCLYYEKKNPGDDVVKAILRKIERFAVVLDRHESMSPSIITGIWSRSLHTPFDSLAIAANCCQYSLWLDVDDLQKTKQSLSLSMLTMCFLNGEIFYNESPETLSHMTVSQFLHEQSFRGYPSPGLSSTKGCRFLDPQLTKEGLVTKGHLWKLGRRLTVPKRSSWQYEDGLFRLSDLADECRGHPLSEDLEDYIKNKRQFYSNSFAKTHMRTMAKKVVKAINKGEPLRLGELWYPGPNSLGSAIFIDNVEMPDYVFTASCPKRQSSDDYDDNDLDRHVSLGVEFCGMSRVPQLQIQNWMVGLCFYQGCPAQEVVFPWR